jgi:hypothetical protein
MKCLFANLALTTVSGAISPTDTTVQLAAGTGNEFPNPLNGSEYFVATFVDQLTGTQNEIVWVTQRVGDTCTISRAKENTSAKSWSAGDEFSNLLTAGQMGVMLQNDGAGAWPINEENIIYIGEDTGTVNNIICTSLDPMPGGGWKRGMTFNIFVKNTNQGPTNLTLPGGYTAPVQRNDGSPLVAGDLTANEPVQVIFTGTSFITGIHNIATPLPPGTQFYIRMDGNDNNPGLQDSAAGAFATPYGAITAIQSRHTSNDEVIVNIGDGVYSGGFAIFGTKIASWRIRGNSTSPTAVQIDARTNHSNTGGRAFNISSARVTIENMKCWSFQENITVAGSGIVTANNMNTTSPTQGPSLPVTGCYSGTLMLQGEWTYVGATQAYCFNVSDAASTLFGYHDATTSTSFHCTLSGNCDWGGATVIASSCGKINAYNGYVSWSGVVPTAYRFEAVTNGVIFAGGNVNLFPGSKPGVTSTGGQYV